MGETREKHPGRLLRIDDSGYGVVQDLNTRNVLGFAFDQIKGYFGESVKELNLRSGQEIQIEVTGDHVSSVHIPSWK